MSELINAHKAGLHWRLLTTVSALALMASVSAAQEAKASDDEGDRPTVWIELGGQWERQTGQGDAYIPDFITNNASAPGFAGLNFRSQGISSYSNAIDGKLTFEPEDSQWVFTAAVLFGRANGSKNLNRVLPGATLKGRNLYSLNNYAYPPDFACCRTTIYQTFGNQQYANMISQADETHAVVDFLAGRDFGLGMFGNGSSSVVSAGVRFAQFAAKSNVAIHGLPSVKHVKVYHHFDHLTYTLYAASGAHRYGIAENSARNFHGVGPTLSWNGSAPLLGNMQGGEIELDWGANAALLFGRQHASGSHSYDTPGVNYYSGKFARQRTVMVPNFGGFAGVSFRYAAAKVSFGYRGDFFFGAMDAGNDTKKAETVGFYGPFAAISIGLGG